jgi:hypothetical protein
MPYRGVHLERGPLDYAVYRMHLEGTPIKGRLLRERPVRE